MAQRAWTQFSTARTRVAKATEGYRRNTMDMMDESR